MHLQVVGALMPKPWSVSAASLLGHVTEIDEPGQTSGRPFKILLTATT